VFVVVVFCCLPIRGETYSGAYRAIDEYILGNLFCDSSILEINGLSTLHTWSGPVGDAAGYRLTRRRESNG